MVAYTDKTSRFYMSPFKEDLDNLANYSDPMGFKESLKDFTYTFNGKGVGTLNMTITIINPSLAFEDNILQLYRMYFLKGRDDTSIAELDFKSLVFYLRWGYGDTKEDGISRIVPCTLVDINYRNSSTDERVIVLTLVDQFTAASRKDPAHVSSKTVVQTEVDCIKDDSLRKPSEVVSELLGKFMSTFNGVVPVVFLQGDNGVGKAIEDYYEILVDKLSGESLNGNVAYGGLGQEVVSTNTVVGDLLAEALNWVSVKVGVPTELHRLMAFQILLEEFGIETSFGREEREVEEVSDSRNSLPGGASEQTAAATASISDSVIVGLDLKVPDNDSIYSGTEWVGTVREVLDNPDLSGLAFPATSIKPNPSTGKNDFMARVGGQPMSLSVASMVSTLNPNAPRASGRYTHRTHPDSDVWEVRYSFSFINSLSNECNTVRTSLEIDSTSDINKVVKWSPSRETLNLGNSYGKAFLTKSTSDNSRSKILSIVEKINKALLPLIGSDGGALTLMQVSWATLSAEEQSLLASIVPPGISDDEAIMLISSKQSIRSKLHKDTKADLDALALDSFPGLQVGNTLELAQGYKDSIVVDIDFHESILPMYPTSMKSFSIFKDIASAYKVDGVWDIVEVLFRDISDIATEEGVGLVYLKLINKFDQARKEGGTSFLNFYKDWATRSSRGETTSYERQVVSDSKYATAFAALADDEDMFRIFKDGVEKTYTYEYEDGRMRVETHNNFKSIALNDTLFSYLSNHGDEEVANLERTLMHDYLVSNASFQITVKTLGIPEISNPLADIGTRGSRKVRLKVAEIRKPGEAQHWLSGFYELVGYTHTYTKETGLLTEFNLVRNPVATRDGDFK